MSDGPLNLNIYLLTTEHLINVQPLPNKHRPNTPKDDITALDNAYWYRNRNQKDTKCNSHHLPVDS
jgi:hypothetical protein